MTSSYRNTNYLSTEADLSSAVNKQIDADIADTRQFYDQMVELEKLRYQNRDDNLSALTNLIKSAAPIIQDIREANATRELTKGTVGIAKEALSDLNSADNTDKEINDYKKIKAQAQARIKKDIDEAETQEEKVLATDVYHAASLNPITFDEIINNKANLTKQATNIEAVVKGLSKDNNIDAIGKKMLSEAVDVDEFNIFYDQYEYMIYQQLIRQARLEGRNYTIGQIQNHFSPTMVVVREKFKTKWNDERVRDIERRTRIYESQEVKSLFSSDTTTEDVLGKEGWIATQKAKYEASGMSTKDASLQAALDFSDYVLPALQDPDSGIDAAKVREFLNSTFTPVGSEKQIRMDDPRAPLGIQKLYRDLSGALDNYSREAEEQREANEKLKMKTWGDVEHVEFVETLNNITDSKERFVAVQNYLFRFRKEFSLTNEDAYPDFIKDFLANFGLADEAIVVKIRGRRAKNLPVTQSMVDQIADPDIRARESKNVNTPELGAFTEEEAESMDERVVAIVKEAKQLRDLDKAKTDKYIVTRDNTKEYITARFKELVIGGQSRKTAMFNAIKEAKAFVKDGTFDKEEVLPINVQATKDLDSTLKAIGKDPSLIYSTEEWAGEAPHLALAREYVRTKGRSKYPSYYMRFNFIKNSDGAYLTPEEIFETRVNKVDKKEAKVEEIPERKELDNVEDQNKLLNKNNSTKTLDVALKNNNMDWMIKSSPTFSEVNAEAFIRQLEINIQNQHSITGIAQTHRQKTTLSAEDSNKLLEAVPELKEAPFLNPNTLSTAAINAMLKLNI